LDSVNIFNFADMAITLGAVLLVLVLGRSTGRGAHDRGREGVV
jgi:lipoprotein signal peptidase